MKRDWIIEQVNKLLIEGEGSDTDVLASAIVMFLENEGLLNTYYGDQEVSAVIETFKEKFGTTKASKWDRFAAKRLVAKHGVQAILKLIEALSTQSSSKYAPTVNNVAQIEEKLPSIVKFLNGQTATGVKEL